MRNAKPFLLLLVLTTSYATQAKSAERPWFTFDRAHTKQYADEYVGVISAVQYLLRARGHKVAVDGVFGAKTENALKAFQRKIGTGATGKINVATWEALIVPLKQGARGDQVRALQTLLNGFTDPLPVDGVFGAKTRAALLQVQKNRGLKVDGVAGKETWSNLSIGGWEGC